MIPPTLNSFPAPIFVEEWVEDGASLGKESPKDGIEGWEESFLVGGLFGERWEDCVGEREGKGAGGGIVEEDQGWGGRDMVVVVGEGFVDLKGDPKQQVLVLPSVHCPYLPKFLKPTTFHREGRNECRVQWSWNRRQKQRLSHDDNVL